MKYLIGCISLFIILQSCSDKDTSTQDFSFLNGNHFVMKVERIADLQGIQFPIDELEETNYRDYSGDKSYTLSFSEDALKVKIEPGDIAGNNTNLGTESVSYTLTEGLFAEGRLNMWIVNDKIEAELIIYGSGVPIISGERGRIIQK